MSATAKTPQTMVLRFRDLSVNSGETIQKHLEIIQAKGSVWWGWWKKLGEEVPISTFRDFASRSGKSRFDIYLFDTGGLSLYKASLLDIYWDAKGGFVTTPSPELTPSYYAGSKYLSWFRLESIELVSGGEAFLKGWSYVGVEDFFETNKSIFLDFYDKQVASFLELKHQERTIWFIRPYDTADLTHEIHVYDSARVVPSNFPSTPVASPSNLLLWISDPHFSEDHHQFPLNSDQYGWDLSETIRKDLEAFRNAREVAAVLVSGDFTWKADASEFALAKSFMESVKSWATLQYNSFVICPGNHDLAFTNEPWKKGEAPTVAPTQASQNYSDFYQSLFSVRPNAWFCCGRRFQVANAKVVEIISLNSSVLRQISRSGLPWGGPASARCRENGVAIAIERSARISDRHVAPSCRAHHPSRASSIRTAIERRLRCGGLMQVAGRARG